MFGQVFVTKHTKKKNVLKLTKMKTRKYNMMIMMRRRRREDNYDNDG